MYLYNKRCVSVLSVKEVLLVIIRTFYLTPLYLILTYYKLYRYLIVCFTIARCFRLKLMRNYERIEAEKVTFN